MTASQIPFEPGAFTAPVVDYEPPPFGVAARGVAGTPCPASPYPSGGRRPQSPAALRRSPRRPLRPVDRGQAEVAPPPEAAKFADAALRRVLEVIDRRRPIAQLRGTLTPPLLDMVYALARTAAPDKAAVLRRVRLRAACVDGPGKQTLAAEVFATYTRGPRVRAIAGRVEMQEGRWRVVALQVG